MQARNALALLQNMPGGAIAAGVHARIGDEWVWGGAGGGKHGGTFVVNEARCTRVASAAEAGNGLHKVATRCTAVGGCLDDMSDLGLKS